MPRPWPQERLLVDARWTWKPYRVAYEVIKALRGLDTGAVVEVITKDDKGLLNDLGIWCRAVGHELLGVQPGEGEARVLIRKGEPVRNDKTMTVIMSTASLEQVVYPLDKALAGAVLGMDVNVVFEGAAVRLLKRGRPHADVLSAWTSARVMCSAAGAVPARAEIIRMSPAVAVRRHRVGGSEAQETAGPYFKYHGIFEMKWKPNWPI